MNPKQLGQLEKKQMEENNISTRRSRSNIRHCMVVYKPYPYNEIRVRREANALLASGHQVDVICPKVRGDKTFDTYEGVSIYRTRIIYGRKSLAVRLFKYIGFMVLAAIRLTFLHIKNPYNVIQVHNIPDFLVFAAIFPKLTGAKVILDLHDLMPEFFLGDFSKGSNRFLQHLLFLQEKLSCKFADHVITVTKIWRQTLIERGVPAEKCSVVMNLADPQIFTTQGFDAANAEGNHQFRLIYHGSIPKRYGLDLVLFALHELKDRIPSIHFTIIGGGDHLPELKQLANELALSGKHVEFIPMIPPEEIPKHIALANLGIVPYRDDVFTDTLLPTKLLEYAKMGLPVIASRTTGISSYFDDTMVKFFKPNDVSDLAKCILELYTEKDKLASYAQGISQFNRGYNWQDASNAYVATVEKLVNV